MFQLKMRTPSDDLNDSALKRELLGHSIANIFVLIGPLIHWLVRAISERAARQRRLAANNGGAKSARTSADGLILVNCE